MTTPTIFQLAGLAQQFNQASQQAIGQNPALVEAVKTAWTSDVQEALDAINEEYAPLDAEQNAAAEELQALQPQQDIPDELREMLTQMGMGDQLPPKLEGPAPEVDEAAIAAAEAKLEAIGAKIVPLVIKQADVLAGVAEKVLGDVFNKIVPAQVRHPAISEGFAAQGAANLAKAFAPQP